MKIKLINQQLNTKVFKHIDTTTHKVAILYNDLDTNTIANIIIQQIQQRLPYTVPCAWFKNLTVVIPEIQTTVYPIQRRYLHPDVVKSNILIVVASEYGCIPIINQMA